MTHRDGSFEALRKALDGIASFGAIAKLGFDSERIPVPERDIGSSLELECVDATNLIEKLRNIESREIIDKT